MANTRIPRMSPHSSILNKNAAKMSYLLQYFIMLTFLLLIVPSDSQLVITITNNSNRGVPISIYNSSANPMLDSSFMQFSNSFNCSLSPLYTYIQSEAQYKENTPYQLNITATNNTNITTAISTEYSSINAQINNGSVVVCSAYPCVMEVRNNCNLPRLNYFNYFDVVRLNVSSLDFVISYYVLCNKEFQGSSFEIGLLIEIIFCTLMITIVALYSNAWSIGGAGWRISLPLVLFFNAIIIIGGIVAVFKFQVVEVAVNVLSWGFGIAAVWLCANQSLFLLKRITGLRYQLIKVRQLSIRVLDMVSLAIALGFCFAWWFSKKNWIINDIIACCMIIAAMKVLKFTSLKQAIICFCITIGIQMIFVLVLTFNIKKNYNTIILNIFNNPFQLQIPTINPVYNQKCAWLPVTALIYPGCLMSYMRRFDTSRNTKVYIVTCVSVFALGSVIWMFISIASQDSWPFGLIAEPATLGFISFFAWKRKEIRTLWTGKFYDEQFAHKEGLKAISQSIEKERGKTQIKYHAQLFSGLHMKDQQSSIEYPEPTHKNESQNKNDSLNGGQNSPDNLSDLDRSLITKTQSVYEQKIQIQPVLVQIEAQAKEKDKGRLTFTKFPMPMQKGSI